MSFRIGSFNVKNLSYGNTGRDIDRIAALIKDNKFDIIALQEVLSEGKILKGAKLGDVRGQAKSYERSLLARLGNNWDCQWLPPDTQSKYYPYLGNDNRGEGYAFIWNTNKFEFPRKADNTEEGTEILPWTEHRYSTKGDSIIRLIRDPGVARFKVKGRPMEIRLITTHIVYGKPKDENLDADLDIGAITMRRNEFSILAGWIYKKINDDSLSLNCTDRCTILLGDYNLNLKSSGVPSAILPDVAYFDKNGRAYFPQNGIDVDNAPIKVYTLQNGLSTLKQKEAGLANNFDHFSMDEDTKNKFVQGVSVIDGINHHVEPGDGTEESKYNTYREKVSDHLPIMIELRC